MKKIIITISREYGSGGRLIGEQVADKLGIAFYNRNLIDMVAHKSGLSKDYISQWEEKLSSRFIWRPYSARSALGQGLAAQKYYTNEEKMFQTQTAIIKEIAERESCVIVGRCADYILQDYKNCMKVFIHADIDSRIKRVIRDYGVDTKTAASTITRTDKGRAAYHNYYTDIKWGNYRNYHFSVDSSVFGLEWVANIIVHAVSDFNK